MGSRQGRRGPMWPGWTAMWLPRTMNKELQDKGFPADLDRRHHQLGPYRNRCHWMTFGLACCAGRD